MAFINIRKWLGILAYPPGSIYITTKNVDPAEMWGGTWERFAQGRTLVGIHPDTTTAGQTMGSKTHTLTTAELPSHTHTFTGNAISHAHTFGITQTSGYVKKGANLWSVHGAGYSGSQSSYASSAESFVAAGTNSATGSGQAHNNIQPSITVYMWKRIKAFS